MRKSSPRAKTLRGFKVGDRVIHEHWGEGTVDGLYPSGNDTDALGVRMDTGELVSAFCGHWAHTERKPPDPDAQFAEEWPTIAEVLPIAEFAGCEKPDGTNGQLIRQLCRLVRQLWGRLAVLEAAHKAQNPPPEAAGGVPGVGMDIIYGHKDFTTPEPVEVDASIAAKCPCGGTLIIRLTDNGLFMDCEECGSSMSLYVNPRSRKPVRQE